MKVSIHDLSGKELDRAVYRCIDGTSDVIFDSKWARHYVRYSTDWAYGGPIIERERINLEPFETIGDKQWASDGEWESDSPLVSAMRYYVASKLGDADGNIDEQED